MQAEETWVQSLGWEDPLEEDMANFSNILAWKFPWAEEPSGIQSRGPQRMGQLSSWTRAHTLTQTLSLKNNFCTSWFLRILNEVVEQQSC